MTTSSAAAPCFAEPSADALRDRTPQFAPFAALTGCKAAVGETARLAAEKRGLDVQETEELKHRLTSLVDHLQDRPEATIEYFVPDDLNCNRSVFFREQRVLGYPESSGSPGANAGTRLSA